MSFVNYPFLLFGLSIIVLYGLYLIRFEKKFFNKIKLYWFFEQSLTRKISTALFLSAFAMFAVSLGDLRGKEVIVESAIPLQKTVVLIDSSASMLVEDVRPNRIKKAGLVARHFVRNSFGHQVSLSVFSDIQKKIVPFTDDIDILESRLATLMETSPKGSSNLTLAIKETIQYFRTKDGFSAGNILLITDGEEHSTIDMELPKQINLAVVGLGSEKGGKIPLRRRDGSFLRYKKHQGQEVVSKINKKFFEEIIAKSASGKVWYVQSYGLPTNEILDFFNKAHKSAFTKGTFRQRPVKGYFLIKIGIVLFVLSVIFSRFKSLVPVLLICIFNLSTMANQNEIEKNYLLNKFKKGQISKIEKLRLAEIFSQEKGQEKKALKLYQKSLKDIDKEKTEDVFNFATTLLKTGGYKDGIELYKYLDEKRELSPEVKEIVKKHIQLAFKKNKSKGGSGKDDKEKKKDKKDKKNKDQKNKDQKDNKNKKGDQKKKPDDKKDNKDKKKKSGKDKKNKNKKKEKKKWEDLKKQVEKKKKTSTVKGVLKQIMNDDSNLQRKFLDTSSDDSNSVRDW